MRIAARLILAMGLLGGQSPLSAPASSSAPEAAASPEETVSDAIDRLRGVRLEGISADEKSALGQRLDAAWQSLYEHPDAARKAILAVLATEPDDHFLLVDLAHFLTTLDPPALEAAAGALVRADVSRHPSGTFHAVSRMAALHCGSCLPAVTKILEIEDPQTRIEQHALSIDPHLMLIFTLGQYGDDAIGPVLGKLDSDSCVVRTNAALALGLLQPIPFPGEIRRIATEDPCDEARNKAWIALGLLDDHLLARDAAKRLKRAPPPSRVERLGITLGLGSSFLSAARKPLKTLADDPEPDVAAAATQALLGYEEMEKRMAPVKMRRAGGSPIRRSRVVRQLENAVREGRIDVDVEDLLTTLNRSDIPLLNRARAAVLGRLSDECLYEYYPMSYAARALRNHLARGDSTGTADQPRAPFRDERPAPGPGTSRDGPLPPP